MFEYTIGHDLAYDSRDVEVSTARELTERFLGLFGDDAYFFTVGTHTEQGKLRTWTRLTIHTLDTGVAAVDARYAGALWKTGED